MGHRVPGDDRRIAASVGGYEDDERQTFLSLSGGGKTNSEGNTLNGNSDRETSFKSKQLAPNSEPMSAKSNSKERKAQLARQETMDEYENLKQQAAQKSPTSCFRMLVNTFKRKVIFIPLLIISCIAAIYCVPFIDIETQIPKRRPNIPFNFNEGPLRPSTASQFNAQHLFRNEVQGPESVALDSMGNMYLAIEGGFILYTHLNTSSPIKRAYYEIQQQSSIQANLRGSQEIGSKISVEDVVGHLVKIAELNGIKQLHHTDHRRRARQDGHHDMSGGGSWRRECQLDEKVYGQKLYSGGLNFQQHLQNPNEIDRRPEAKKFKPYVMISRCSKPLGIRLSPDESYLYVVDTLSGLYRVSLRTAERPYSTQRLVTKLVDFRTNRSQLLPIVQYDKRAQDTPPPVHIGKHTRGYLNISLMAVDDLVIDYGAGTRGGDLIYMTDASQVWPATSVIYDMLEGRPSGVVLRYDSGTSQLSVLDPFLLSQVRTTAAVNEIDSPRSYATGINESAEDPYLGVGAPRLDENDIFDDRPLHFPNGLELTDDRQAILIADTLNMRIIKHWLRGPRRGSSDLWAWTPMYVDNIRRGYDREQETYWVVGCGEDMSNKFDLLNALESWPHLRKYLLKNVYLFGWIIENFGHYVLGSTAVRDWGYSFKTGNYLCTKICPGMIIIQYNKYGDIIRSIHSREFPNDLQYYSQVNELIDAKTREQVLYLSSPSYDYVTKLTLPTDVHPPDSTSSDSVFR